MDYRSQKQWVKLLNLIFNKNFKPNKMTQFDKLPVEIQERMLEEQEKQGNKRDPDVFRKILRADEEGRGFNWDETDDGPKFWISVLTEEDFDCFFARYPKKEELLKKDTKTYPKVMEVSNFEDFSNPRTRVVFMEKNGKYLAWGRVSTLEEAEETLMTTCWSYAREVNPIVELTAEDISAGKGVGVDPKLIRFKE